MSSHHFVESGSPRRSTVQGHSLMNQMLLEDGQCFVPQQSREGHCQDYERALRLPQVDGLQFGQVRRRILGKRCRQLKRIERLTGATLTLHGPTPSYLTVQHARPEGLERAVAMTNALLESLFGDTGRQEHDKASAPSSSALGCLASVPPLEQYLTEGEMILLLTRLGLTHAGDLVAEMRLSGLPFGESLPMPSVSGPHVEESMCGAYAGGRVSSSISPQVLLPQRSRPSVEESADGIADRVARTCGVGTGQLGTLHGIGDDGVSTRSTPLGLSRGFANSSCACGKCLDSLDWPATHLPKIPTWLWQPGLWPSALAVSRSPLASCKVGQNQRWLRKLFWRWWRYLFSCSAASFFARTESNFACMLAGTALR